MSFLNFLKKKDVPDELPDLVSDELGKNSSPSSEKIVQPSANSNLEIPELPDIDSYAEPKVEASSVEEVKKALKASPSQSDEKIYAEEVKKAVESDLKSEKSFFNDLQKSISSEFSDLDKIEEWYKNDFSKKDVLSEMKDYWESKKTSTILQTIGNDFKEKIDEKTKKLQNLEKEWQNIYFEMVEKEEEIKDEEAELKKVLSEFVDVCKRRKKSLENDEQKKPKETREKKRK